jgi:DNA-binding protein H-NS
MDELEGLPDDMGMDLPIDASEAALTQLVQLQQQSQQQIAQAMQEIAQMQAQLGQRIIIALLQIAETNSQVAAALKALSAPRRRVPIRDKDGRITEAHDMPMGM